jgi:murE/murF fusion protein
MVDAAVAAGMNQSNSRPFSSKEELAGWLQQLADSGHLSAGDWVLIKGSRGMRMENVLELLRSNRNHKQTIGN